MFKEMKLPNPHKKLWQLSTCHHQKHHATFKSLMVWHNSTDVLLRIFAFIMAISITNYFIPNGNFEWTIKCQNLWEIIKNKYLNAPILITPRGILNFMYPSMHPISLKE
jgi:hypothetical protein